MGAWLGGLGQTEISDLHMAAIIDQNVLGLDVTVDHAGAMRGSQTIQRLRDHAQRLTHGECALGVHLMPQIDAMHIFHDQKIKSIELAGVIHLNDVRVGDGTRPNWPRGGTVRRTAPDAGLWRVVCA